MGDTVIEIIAGGDIDKNKVVEFGKYPIYANSHSGDGIVGYYDDFYRVNGPAVTVTGRGEVGFAKARETDFTPVVRLLAIRSKHNHYFLENAINLHGVTVESTGVPQLTVPQLSAYRIYFPYDIQEENQIGTFFSTLDRHITLHQRKLDKLKSVKQAYLSEMFPAEGERVPKRRFPGFTDAWELRRIFEIADRFDNLRIPIASSLRVPGSTPYYGANGIQDYVEGYTHDGEFVLVAEDGANDLKNYPVNLVNGKIWVNNHAHVLQGKENIANNNFLSYSINRANIEVLLVGGGRAKLNSDVLMDIELEIPSLPEQEAIGNFFSTLDSQITLHQRKSI